MKKKIIVFISLLIIMISSAVSYEVFNYKYPYVNEAIIMELEEDTCVLLCGDELSSEIAALYFSKSEIERIKELAFESKIIAKNIINSPLEDNKEIFKKILKMMVSISERQNVSYDDYNGSYIKVTEMITAQAFKELSDVSVDNQADQRNFVVWSCTYEIQAMITNYYRIAYPDIAVDYENFPTDQFPDKLDEALANKNKSPDVITLEEAFVRKYVEQGPELLLDLTDVYNEVKDKVIQFPFQAGSYNGRVYALSWQSCPGAMFYRRSIARKYLGTDDPAEIQKLFCNWESYLKTARILKEKSGGTCVVTASDDDIIRPFLGSRKNPWIVNGRLNVDPVMIEYMKMCKIINDEGLCAGVSMWENGWFDGMKKNLHRSDNTKVEVFAYFFPSWGLHYVLKPNAPETHGDWAMIEGPSAYYWGGSWLAISKNSSDPEKAKNLVKYLCTDENCQNLWAMDTGDFVVNKKAIEKAQENNRESFLAGQNAYKEFAKIADKVNGNLTQGTDTVIESIWNEEVKAYSSGKKTLDQAINDFKNNVNMLLGY